MCPPVLDIGVDVAVQISDVEQILQVVGGNVSLGHQGVLVILLGGGMLDILMSCIGCSVLIWGVNVALWSVAGGLGDIRGHLGCAMVLTHCGSFFTSVARLVISDLPRLPGRSVHGRSVTPSLTTVSGPENIHQGAAVMMGFVSACASTGTVGRAVGVAPPACCRWRPCEPSGASPAGEPLQAWRRHRGHQQEWGWH